MPLAKGKSKAAERCDCGHPLCRGWKTLDVWDIPRFHYEAAEEHAQEVKR